MVDSIRMADLAASNTVLPSSSSERNTEIGHTEREALTLQSAGLMRLNPRLHRDFFFTKKKLQVTQLHPAASAQHVLLSSSLFLTLFLTLTPKSQLPTSQH